MPKVRAVDEMNETELRAELVSLLADGVIRYMQSEQFAIDHADRDFDTDFETACHIRPEAGGRRRKGGRMTSHVLEFTPASRLRPPAYCAAIELAHSEPLQFPRIA